MAYPNCGPGFVPRIPYHFRKVGPTGNSITYGDVRVNRQHGLAQPVALSHPPNPPHPPLNLPPKSRAYDQFSSPLLSGSAPVVMSPNLAFTFRGQKSARFQVLRPSKLYIAPMSPSEIKLTARKVNTPPLYIAPPIPQSPFSPRALGIRFKEPAITASLQTPILDRVIPLAGFGGIEHPSPLAPATSTPELDRDLELSVDLSGSPSTPCQTRVDLADIIDQLGLDQALPDSSPAVQTPGPTAEVLWTFEVQHSPGGGPNCGCYCQSPSGCRLVRR